MASVTLDRETADRILAGDVHPSDAPPGYERLCELFEALREEAQQTMMPVIATAARNVATRRATPLSRRGRRSLVAFAVALSLTGGVAYAAGLPQSASRAGSDILERLGISVPGVATHAPPTADGERATTAHAEAGDHETGSAIRRSGTKPSSGGRKGAGNSAKARIGKRRGGGGQGHGRAVRRGRHAGQPPGHVKPHRGRGPAHATPAGVGHGGTSGRKHGMPRHVPPAGHAKWSGAGGNHRPPRHTS
jgi:hypothetical protein